MKRLVALSALALAGLGVGIAPAGAITQSNTKTITFSNQTMITNTGGKVQTSPAQIHFGSTGGTNSQVVTNVWTTPDASAVNNPNIPPINQSNTNP
ncbi:MAG TPA: hypothetical protein VK461_13090 [Acidimicrobiales bacterium]|nr:hypothetical protein [Acidimicrobiales bacterium]